MKTLKIIAKREKGKFLIVFDDMVSHVMSDKKAQKVLKIYLLGAEN